MEIIFHFLSSLPLHFLICQFHHGLEISLTLQVALEVRLWGYPWWPSLSFNVDTAKFSVMVLVPRLEFTSHVMFDQFNRWHPCAFVANFQLSGPPPSLYYFSLLFQKIGHCFCPSVVIHCSCKLCNPFFLTALCNPFVVISCDNIVNQNGLRL
jgi:hypothetical protein